MSHRYSVRNHINFHILCSGTDIDWNLEDLWNPHQKSPSSWLSLLCYHLINTFVLGNDKEKCEHHSTEDIASGIPYNGSLPSHYRGRKYPELYLDAVSHICLLRFDICKEIFPLVIQFIIHSYGMGSNNIKLISDRLHKYLLDSESDIQVTKVGVNLLTFLLAHDIREFLREKKHSIERSYQRKETSKSMDDSDQLDWSLPFSCILDVTFVRAASAAVRCNNICSALLFAELSAELDRPFKLPGTITKDLNNTLIPIYKVIHDAHAICKIYFF